MQTGQLYSINFGSGKLVPIDTSDKNNLPIGTVLQLNGYDNPEYVIIGNLGINARFPGYGAMYATVSLDTGAHSQKEASSLKWLKDKTSDMIQTYITDRVLSSDEVAGWTKKADAVRTDKEERQAIATRENDAAEAKGRALFAKYIPVDAQALLVASRDQDDSDMQSDYFNHTTTATVILGYSKHKKDLFAEMRKAAVMIPETAHLGPGCGHFKPVIVAKQDFKNGGCYCHEGSISHWHYDLQRDEAPVFRTRAEAEAYTVGKIPEPISFDGVVVPFGWEIREEAIEHREKYSMGAGYYLKDGGNNRSGWRVEKVTKYGADWDSGLYVAMGLRCVFEKVAP